MADVWTFDAGTDTFTLTLDGSGTGVVSRSKTFGSGDGLAASTLYTWLLAYTTDTADVEPFLEVDGGDRDTGTSTTGTLRVSGTTDGSANITLRFGVAEAGAAPSSSTSDAMAYADQAAAEAGGWTITNTTSNGTISYDNPGPVGAFTHCIGMARNGPGSGGGFMTFLKEFSLTPSAQYNGSLWVDPDGTGFEELAMRIENSDNTSARTLHAGGTKPTGQFFTAGNMTTKPDGIVRVRIQLTTGFGSPHSDKYLWAGFQLTQVGGAVTTDVSFTGGITFCEGTGPGDGGTGLGGDPDTPGDDPIPGPPPDGYPPPLIGGARPMVTWDIPAGGAFYWNGSLQHFGAGNTANLINAAGSNDAFLLFIAGSRPDWLDGSGRFSFTLWRAAFDEVLDNPSARNALEDGITSGTVPFHYIIDEPYYNSPRYGGAIPLRTVEMMCQYSKGLGAPFNTWPTVVGAAPYDHRFWLTRAISGCNYYFHDYTLNLGDINTWLANNFARATSLNAGFVPGIHYYGFDRPRDLPGDTERVITPSEFRHYGGIIAARSDTPFFPGWKYHRRVVSQPGWLDAQHYVRDLYASNDP